MSNAHRLGAPELDALVERVRKEAQRAGDEAWAKKHRLHPEEGPVAENAAAWDAERAAYVRHLRELGEALLDAREIVALWRSRPWPDESGYVDNITRLSRTDLWDGHAARLLAETTKEGPK